MSFLKAAIQFDLQQYASNGSTADKLPFSGSAVVQIATSPTKSRRANNEHCSNYCLSWGNLGDRPQCVDKTFVFQNGSTGAAQ